MTRLFLSATVVVALLSGCKGQNAQSSTPPGLGQKLVEGEVHDLRVTPDGKMALFLGNAKKPMMGGIPPMMLLGELQAAPVSGGSTLHKLSKGVVNVPGGYVITSDSKYVLALADYDLKTSSGTLELFDLAKADDGAKKLGVEVSYVLPSPDASVLAFVTQGTLKMGPLPDGPFEEVAKDVQQAAFSKDGSKFAYKQRLTSQGGLWLIPSRGAAPKKLGEQCGEFTFSPDGNSLGFTERGKTPSTYDLSLADAPGWTPRVVSGGSPTFQFSPDGKYLARLEGQMPGVQGSLVVGPANGKQGRKLGERVADYNFSPDSKSIGYLERFDETARAGVMGVVSLPDGKPQLLGYRVPNFTWSPDGKSLAFLARFLKPIFSVDLMLYRVGDEKADKVQTGVFGYGFDPKGQDLYLRSNCVRNGRACDLMTLDLSSAKRTPVKTMEGIYAFRHAEKGERMMVTYARVESESLYDVAVFDPSTKAVKMVDRKVRAPVIFGDDEGKALVYLVGDRGRYGLYAARDL